MNYFKSIMLTAFALFALAACDTDDLRDDVDNLKDRVESLEAQVSLLNDNMTAIKRLLEGGQTITEVTNTDGTYKLKLSNGETISLTQGSKGEVAYSTVRTSDPLIQDGSREKCISRTLSTGFSTGVIRSNIFSRLSARLMDFSRLKERSFSMTAC